MTLQEAIWENNAKGLNKSKIATKMKDEYANFLWTTDALELFQIADWLEELREYKKKEVKFKGRCKHGNMHYECKYCKEGD